MINVGVGEDLTISGLAQTIASIGGYQSKLIYDTSKPDGTILILLDMSLINRLGWIASIDIRTIINQEYESRLGAG